MTAGTVDDVEVWHDCSTILMKLRVHLNMNIVFGPHRKHVTCPLERQIDKFCVGNSHSLLWESFVMLQYTVWAELGALNASCVYLQFFEGLSNIRYWLLVLLQMARGCWLYFISKFTEFFDTVSVTIIISSNMM